MKAQVLTGSKSEIADSIIRMAGDIREVIVFVDEPVGDSSDCIEEDMFAEMEPFTVEANDVDYSRESIYTPMEGE